MILTDNSPMPFGKHKGTAMANVPARYLMWLYYEGTNNRDVMNYILFNLDALRLEVEKEGRK